MTPAIFAVKPSDLGSVVHLSSPGYKPGKKTRPLAYKSALCNVLVSRQETVPLADALRWPESDAGSVWGSRSWTWCRACIGHAVAIRDLQRRVLLLIEEAEVSP